MTQTALGERLGVNQGTISRWETGENTPSLEEIRAVEEATGRPRGFVFIHAGFVELPSSLGEAIDAAVDVNDSGREFLRSAYQTARAQLDTGPR